jgi:Flp pilus assembly protein TadG
VIRHRGRRHAVRRGTAVAEFAFILPVLAFFLVIGVDFARVYNHSLIIATGARNGAIYASQSETKAADSVGIRAAALADMSNLSPTPTVTSTIVTDAAGIRYALVTVEYPFSTVTDYPGVPSNLTIRQSCQIRIQPAISLEPLTPPPVLPPPPIPIP